MIKFKTKKTKTKKPKRIQKIAKPKIKVVPKIEEKPKIEEEPKIEKKNIFFIYHDVKKKNRFKVEKESDEEDQKKKRVKFVVSNLELGRWSYEEHKRFVRSIVKYPNNWVKITKEVKTRSDVQIRSHSQKFFKKLKKCKSEQLGIDFTSDTIHSIKDMIDHVNAVNNNYDIIKIFLHLPKLCEIRETIKYDSEDEEINFDKYENDLIYKNKNKNKKNTKSPPQIQNINENFNLNNILYINYINSINNNINSFILNYIVNQNGVNNGFNPILSNYIENLQNYNILPQYALNNNFIFNNVNLNNNISNNIY